MFENYSAEFYKIGNAEMKENLETFFLLYCQTITDQ